MEFKKTVLAIIFIYAAWGAAYVVLPLYLDSLGISFDSIGILFGIGGLLSGLVLIGIGAYADVLGRKTFASVFTLLDAAAYAIYGLFSSFFPLALIKSSSDFAHNASFNMLSARVIDASHRDRLGRNYGYFFGLSSLAAVPFIVLVGYLIANSGYSFTFLAIGLIAFLGFLTTLTFKREHMEKTKVELFPKVLLDREAWIFTVYNALRGFSFAIIVFAEPLFFRHMLGMGDTEVAIVMSGSWLAYGLSGVVFGPLVDRFGARVSCLLGSVLDGASWIAMVMVQDKWLAIFFYLAGSFFMGPAVIGSFRAMALIPKKEDVGRDNAVFGYAFSAASVLGLFVGGYLAKESLSLNFIVRSVTLVSAGLLALALSKRAD